MKYGYIKLIDSSLKGEREEALFNHGCDHIIIDRLYDFKEKQRRLDILFDLLVEEDVVVVYKLIDIARSVEHVFKIITAINDKGAHLLSIHDKLTEQSSILEYAEAIPSLSADLWDQRIVFRRGCNRGGGRKKKLTDRDVFFMKKLKGIFSHNQIKEIFGVSSNIIARVNRDEY